MTLSLPFTSMNQVFLPLLNHPFIVLFEVWCCAQSEPVMFSFLSINMYCKIFMPHSYIHYHSTRWLVTVRGIQTRKGMQNERHPRCWEIISRVLQSLEGGKGGKGRGKGGNQRHYTTTCWEKFQRIYAARHQKFFLLLCCLAWSYSWWMW